MRYLLDTHALIWFFEKNPLLSSNAESIIIDKNNMVYVSIVSLWEIAIKMSLGKLSLSLTTDKLFERIEAEDFILTALSSEHIRILQTLPLHHRDPFDRMLIAQAEAESCTIITQYKFFPLYQSPIMW